MNIIANKLTKEAERALLANGAQIVEDEIESCVFLPSGSEQLEDGSYRLPSGHILASDEEDLGAFWEHVAPSTIYLKK